MLTGSSVAMERVGLLEVAGKMMGASSTALAVGSVRRGAILRASLIVVRPLQAAVCVFDVSAQLERQGFRLRSKIRPGKPPDTPNRVAADWCSRLQDSCFA